MNNSKRIGKAKANKVIAGFLAFMFLMHQSLCYQVLASTITNGDGSPVTPSTDGSYNIRPDAINGDVGFKHFNDLNLSKGEILNFIYQYYQQGHKIDGNTITHIDKFGDINTFINLVNNGVRIDGIVNALTKLGGDIKSGGNLMFITPNGMAVGASGVINVGTLSVITPTQDSYNALSRHLDLPQSPNYAIEKATVVNGKIDPDSIVYDKNWISAVNTDKTFSRDSLVIGNESQHTITVDGKVFARGDIELEGGTVAVGNTGILIAGIGVKIQL